MPQPTASDVHVNRPLTTYSTAFIQDQNDFVATKVFPIIPSESKSDDYYEYDRADWMRIAMEKRAPGTPSAGGGFTITTASFNCDRWSIHKDVDDPTRANADDPLRPDQDATQWVTEQALRTLEREFLSAFFAAGIWNQQVTPGTLWSAGGSTPIEDVRTQHTRIWSLTGKRPNTAIVSPNVFDVLVDHPDVVARVLYTGPGGSGDATVLGEQELARLFRVQNFLIAGGVTATSAEGAATDTFDFMAGDHMWLGYVDPNPSPQTATAGGIFAWTGLTGASPLGNRIKRFRVEENESDRIEIDIWFDMKIMSNDLGMFFNAPIA